MNNTSFSFFKIIIFLNKFYKKYESNFCRITNILKDLQALFILNILFLCF